MTTEKPLIGRFRKLEERGRKKIEAINQIPLFKIGIAVCGKTIAILGGMAVGIIERTNERIEDNNGIEGRTIRKIRDCIRSIIEIR